MSKENTAILQMLVCAFMWSIAGIFIKLIPWNPFVIAGLRSLVSAVVVIVVMRYQRVPFRLTKGAALSAVFMSLTFICFVCANKLTTAANAIVLQFTAPVFIIVFSAVFLKQKFRPSDVVAVVFTLAGISLFFLDRLASGHILGNIIGVSSGATMAIMYISISNNDDASRTNGMLLGHLLTCAIGLPFIFFTDFPVSAPSVLYILILGVFQLGIPYVLLTLAVRYCPPLACSLLGALEPLLNPIWVLLFYGEQPGRFSLAGGAVVIITITVWCVWKDRRKLPENEKAVRV